jgi:hypothetical protein
MGKNLQDHQNISAVWLPRSFDRLLQAFDIAWPKLMPVITDRGLADDAARRQLADAILLFAEDNRSAAEIAKVALQKLGV